jgi:hypothetical protein
VRWQAPRPALEGVRENAEEGLKLSRSAFQSCGCNSLILRMLFWWT